MPLPAAAWVGQVESEQSWSSWNGFSVLVHGHLKPPERHSGSLTEFSFSARWGRTTRPANALRIVGFDLSFRDLKKRKKPTTRAGFFTLDA